MKAVFALAVSVLAAGAAQADPEFNAERFVLGVAAKDSRAARGLDQQFCTLEPSGDWMVPEAASVLVIGKETCSSRFDPKPREFYRVAVRGDVRWMLQESLLVPAPMLQRLDDVKPEEKETYETAAKELSGELRRGELRKAMDAVQRTKPKGVALVDYSVYDVSEYTQGTGFRFEVLNPTDKVIKYITATVVGLNAVNDPVRSLRGGTTLTFRGVGPIEPKESAAYSFDYAWHTDLVESARLVSLKVEYMDKTTRVITSPREVLLPNSVVKTIQSASD